MVKENQFTSTIVWTGNTGEGTKSYRSYQRSWDVAIPGKPVVHCSNDPELGGDPGLMNPEDMLITALSACHMLWYLHLASVAKIVVLDYRDDPIGHGETEKTGAARFKRAELRPTIKLQAGADLERAAALHDEIHKYCFIARSVNFPVDVTPEFIEI